MRAQVLGADLLVLRQKWHIKVKANINLID